MSPDSDGDGIPDFRDPCPNNPNPACQQHTVVVDIKPGVSPNVVNLKSEGTIQFAILGGSTLDVAQIDVNTLVLHGAPAKKCKVKQVDADGIPDLICEVFLTDMTNLSGNNFVAVLTGRLLSGDPIVGEDVIIVKKGP